MKPILQKKNSFINKIINFGKVILIPISIIVAGYIVINSIGKA